jgi:2-keto-4-pentenoate hydratase/2-oxohepta-3-ene-1,7-dioic acid hydratase in catechol pathway
MKLVSFRVNGRTRVGVISPEDESRLYELDEPADMMSLIESGRTGLDRAANAVEGGRSPEHELAGVQLLPPLVPRGNVIAVGRNYEKHAAETARLEGGEPSPPTIFTKAITSLTEPFADIVVDPAISSDIDWEVELAVVIGESGANISRADARTHVFGYMVLNDVTARDLQRDWGGQFFKGKSLDRSCPTGPWIVTADEISDPQELRLSLRVNGETKQEGSTRDMIYAVDALIEWASKGMTLTTGSIIATGTPDGVGFARTPPEYLRPGDVMETEVERIGVLRNRIVGPSMDRRGQ